MMFEFVTTVTVYHASVFLSVTKYYNTSSDW